MPPPIGGLGAPFGLFGAVDVRNPEITAVLFPLQAKLGLLLSLALACDLLVQGSPAAPVRGQRGERHLKGRGISGQKLSQLQTLDTTPLPLSGLLSFLRGARPLYDRLKKTSTSPPWNK